MKYRLTLKAENAVLARINIHVTLYHDKLLSFLELHANSYNFLSTGSIFFWPSKRPTFIAADATSCCSSSSPFTSMKYWLTLKAENAVLARINIHVTLYHDKLLSFLELHANSYNFLSTGSIFFWPSKRPTFIAADATSCSSDDSPLQLNTSSTKYRQTLKAENACLRE